MGCIYEHKVGRTKHPLWDDTLLAEWSFIKEHWIFPATAASPSWVSWAQECCILLPRSSPAPHFGFLYQVPKALLYPLQSEYQLPVCSTQEKRRHRSGAQLAEVFVRRAQSSFHASCPKARGRADCAATIPRAWLSTSFHTSWLCSGNQWSYTARKLVKRRMALTPWRGSSSLVGETILVHTFVNLVPFMSIKSIAFDFKGVYSHLCTVQNVLWRLSKRRAFFSGRG